MRLDGSKLEKLRARKGWTQFRAAKRCGIAYATYNRAEAGQDLQPLKAQKIAMAFGTTLEELEFTTQDDGSNAA